ncbi:UDP-N-acetylmuramate--L-alanine ligase [Paenibacillaceae bacterium]|nr:UDP-N-acetylmuramate--L-alanine ligase [Paenibacillaceae bacterium]
MNTAEHVHFIGIGGYGMSAIARVMLEMGYKVSGSDVALQELTEKLVAKGAQVYVGHKADQVQGADLVVYSTALTQDNVERRAAEENNIPIIHRAQMLSRLMNAGKGIAVAGAHGKTTTSSMIALVMENCNLDPTYIIGGEIVNVGTNAKAGKGEYVVAEADESDGSFLQYHPYIGIVTNIEADHLENYDGDFDKLKAAYAQFLLQVKPEGRAVLCSDDELIRELVPELRRSGGSAVQRQIITYGVEEGADYLADEIELGDRKISFRVNYEGEALGRIELFVPGMHNVCNSLAAVVTCLEAGVPFDAIAEAIKEFRGAKRRFQVLGETNDILVIDDYAHHPTEIQATISAAKATDKRIIAVFQPQRYSRTFFLLDAFSRAFAEADEVIITDIYSPAGEKKIEGVSSTRLVDMIRKNSNSKATHIPTKEEVQIYLEKHVAPGDLVLTMGAGDIWKAADHLAKWLRSN